MEACRDKVRLSIRLFAEEALNDFRDWKAGRTETHWQDLILSDMSEAAVVDHDRVRTGNEVVNDIHRQALLEVWSKYQTSAERIAAFKALVGRGKDCMYSVRNAMLRDGIAAVL